VRGLPAAVLTLTAALVLAAAALAASGSGEPDGVAPADSGGIASQGIEGLQGASCQDWAEAGGGERTLTLQLLEQAVAGPRGDGKVLEREQARGLFGRACASGPGQGLLLYEVYIRAVAFESLGTPP
jgi:hypothetical protein